MKIIGQVVLDMDDNVTEEAIELVRSSFKERVDELAAEVDAIGDHLDLYPEVTSNVEVVRG